MAYSELNGYLNDIQREKIAKIIPENIRDGVTVLGVTGTLEEGVDTSDATATASDILNPKTAYVDGVKLTGNIGTHYRESSDLTTTSISSTVTIHDFNLEGNVAMNVNTNGTLSFYKIVNDTVDTSSVSTYSLDETVHEQNVVFARELYDTDHIMVCVCGDSMKFKTFLLDINTFEVSDLKTSSVTFAQDVQFTNAVAVPNTNNQFLYATCRWYSTGICFGMRILYSKIIKFYYKYYL